MQNKIWLQDLPKDWEDLPKDWGILFFSMGRTRPSRETKFEILGTELNHLKNYKKKIKVFMKFRLFVVGSNEKVVPIILL